MCGSSSLLLSKKSVAENTILVNSLVFQVACPDRDARYPREVSPTLIVVAPKGTAVFVTQSYFLPRSRAVCGTYLKSIRICVARKPYCVAGLRAEPLFLRIDPGLPLQTNCLAVFQLQPETIGADVADGGRDGLPLINGRFPIYVVVITRFMVARCRGLRQFLLGAPNAADDQQRNQPHEGCAEKNFFEHR